MYQKLATNEIAAVNTNVHKDAKAIASSLRLELEKILRRHEKDLKTYLQRAEYPAKFAAPALATARQTSEANKLFTDAEIASFMINADMMPLQKLVILAEIMGRTLVACFDGPSRAQIPLNYSDDPDKLVEALRWNIYPVLSMLGQDARAPIPLNYPDDPDRLAEALSWDISVLTMLSQGGARLNRETLRPYAWTEDCVPATEGFTDCTSIEGVLQSARYHGFRVRLSLRRAHV